MVLAAPVLIAALLMVAFDRSLQTSFFLSSAGGSPYLFENLFWFFGHPEVYVLALPGFGIILELLPVFSRKPLWGYRLAVAGMLGVALLSFFVWQHHLFVSGINSALRPVLHALHGGDLDPDRVHLPVRDGDAVAGADPLHGADAVLPRLVLQLLHRRRLGLLPLRHARATSTTHGSFFVMAHFHYTIMGGLIFAFFAAIYYWVPKMSGLRFNERLAKIHFWMMFIAFNSTFGPLFALGLWGCRAGSRPTRSNLQALNIWVSVSAFVLGASMLVFLANVLYSLVFARKPAEPNPWDSKSLEWQVPTPVPVHNFDRIPVFDSDPYDYGVPPAPPRTRAGGRDRGGAIPRAEVNDTADTPAEPFAEPPEVQERNLWLGARVMAGATHHVLPRLRLRLLLPALAEQRRPLATRRRRSAAGLRRGDRRPVRRSAPALSRTPNGPPVEAPAAWLPMAGMALALGARRLRRSGVRVGNLGFSPTDGGYASVFLGLDAPVHGVRAPRHVLGGDRRSRRASSSARRRGLRAARARRRLLLLDAARGHRRDRLGDPLPALRSGVLDAKPLLDWTGGTGVCLGGRGVAALLAGRTPHAPMLTAPATRRWRTACFIAGLATIVLALDSPIDELAEELLWVHMVQHILLLVVAPPLLALARPWNRMWHGLPLAFRRRTADAVVRSPRLGAAAENGTSVLQDPLVSWLAFNVTFVAWHVPGAYDATLELALRARARARHVLRHRAAVLDAGDRLAPLALTAQRRAPSCLRRLAMLVSWVLAIAFAVATSPVYAPYAAEASRPGGMTALADQQLAAGVMWVPGSIPLAIGILFIVYRWLQPSGPAPRAGIRSRKPRLSEEEDDGFDATLARDLKRGSGDPHLGDPARWVPRGARLVFPALSPPASRVTGTKPQSLAS